MRSPNVGKDVDRPHHISRKLIAVTPLLLICGIIAQTVLLILAVILYIPALLFPALLNGFYRTITKAMARLFAQSLFGRKQTRPPRAEMISGELSFRYLDTRAEVPPGSRVLML